MTLERVYKCQFCGKGFKRQVWYNKHTCEKRKRFEERFNVSTIKAHKLFTHWQRRSGFSRQGKGKTMDEFLKSPYFLSFKALAEFGVENKISSTFKYLDWLIELRLPDRQWCEMKTLKSYFDHERVAENAEVQTKETLTHMRLWANEQQKPLKEFFRIITPSRVVSMVRMNQLSPWVLLGYEASLNQLINRLDETVLQILNEHINIDYWIEKIDRDHSSVEKMKSLLNEALRHDTV